jgi:hypothetical protein
VGDQVRHPQLGWGTVKEVDAVSKRLTVYHRDRRSTRTYRAKLITGLRDRQLIIRYLTPPKQPAPHHRVPRRKLSLEQLREARELRQLGWHWLELAERYGVSYSTIYRRLKR